MSWRTRKAKGTAAERELIHLFWNADWAACRVAGSGSSRFPSPDVLAGNGHRNVVIECKSSKDSIKYIPKDEIESLQHFATKYGAEAWIGLKLAKSPWYFIRIEDMVENNASFSASLEHCKSSGFAFEDFLSLGNRKF